MARVRDMDIAIILVIFVVLVVLGCLVPPNHDIKLRVRSRRQIQSALEALCGFRKGILS